MKFNFLTFFLFTISVYSQNSITASFVNKTSFAVQSLIDIDNFGTQYYINNNTLFKRDADKTINYSNVQLSEINSANAFNTLKINLFYKDFNTAIILDNRLSEIFKIDFNTIHNYKSVTHISTGNDNTIWIFNQDIQQLELFDYKTNKTKATTLPIQSDVLDLKSNFNFSWLLTEQFIYKYNYFGSIVLKLKNNGYQSLTEDNGNIVLQKDDTLFYLKKDNEQIQKIDTGNLLIKQFLLTNQTLYIYTGEILHQFQLKTQ